MNKSKKTINAWQFFLRVATGEAKAPICAAQMQKSLQVSGKKQPCTTNNLKETGKEVMKMSNKEDYEAKIGEITAIKGKNVKSPYMPVDIFVQESEDLFSVVDDNKEKFKAINFDMALIEDLPVRCGACREAESRWQALFNMKEDAQKLWLEESPKAYFMRDDLLDVLRYAFRKSMLLLNRVHNIAKGRGHADMIQDLNDIAALGRDYPNYFSAINFDAAHFEEADIMAYRMAKVLANAHKEDGISEARIIRDKAYTHLKEAVDEIKEAGKFIFRYDPVMLDKFSSDYFRKMNNGQNKDEQGESDDNDQNQTEEDNE